VCVLIVCDLEALTIRRHISDLGCCATEEEEEEQQQQGAVFE
jgi:hypothetical protein